MIDIKNNIGVEEFLNNKKKPQPPKFPESRTIKNTGFSFLGFKPKKVKHIVFIVIYFLSIFIALIEIISTQNGDGISALWLIFNSGALFVSILFTLIIFLIKNWNKEL